MYLIHAIMFQNGTNCQHYNCKDFNVVSLNYIKIKMWDVSWVSKYLAMLDSHSCPTVLGWRCVKLFNSEVAQTFSVYCMTKMGIKTVIYHHTFPNITSSYSRVEKKKIVKRFCIQRSQKSRKTKKYTQTYHHALLPYTQTPPASSFICISSLAPESIWLFNPMFERTGSSPGSKIFSETVQ